MKRKKKSFKNRT